jgi:endonuclease YncB( thermonuclease family)
MSRSQISIAAFAIGPLLIGLLAICVRADAYPQPAPCNNPALPPATGWTTAARITEVYDGDTITVEVTRRFRVRLLDCWAPEIRTRDAEEKARGLEAAAYLTALAEGKDAILHVPLEGIDAAGAWSMGRILGHVWMVGDDRHLSSHMIEAGHATRTKGGR